MGFTISNVFSFSGKCFVTTDRNNNYYRKLLFYLKHQHYHYITIIIIIDHITYKNRLKPLLPLNFQCPLWNQLWSSATWRSGITWPAPGVLLETFKSSGRTRSCRCSRHLPTEISGVCERFEDLCFHHHYHYHHRHHHLQPGKNGGGDEWEGSRME